MTRHNQSHTRPEPTNFTSSHAHHTTSHTSTQPWTNHPPKDPVAIESETVTAETATQYPHRSIHPDLTQAEQETHDATTTTQATAEVTGTAQAEETTTETAIATGKGGGLIHVPGLDRPSERNMIRGEGIETEIGNGIGSGTEIEAAIEAVTGTEGAAETERETAQPHHINHDVRNRGRGPVRARAHVRIPRHHRRGMAKYSLRRTRLRQIYLLPHQQPNHHRLPHPHPIKPLPTLRLPLPRLQTNQHPHLCPSTIPPNSTRKISQ